MIFGIRGKSEGMIYVHEYETGRKAGSLELLLTLARKIYIIPPSVGKSGKFGKNAKKRWRVRQSFPIALIIAIMPR